jgi:hypothetical protein
MPRRQFLRHETISQGVNGACINSQGACDLHPKLERSQLIANEQSFRLQDKGQCIPDASFEIIINNNSGGNTTRTVE